MTSHFRHPKGFFISFLLQYLGGLTLLLLRGAGGVESHAFYQLCYILLLQQQRRVEHFFTALILEPHLSNPGRFTVSSLYQLGRRGVGSGGVVSFSLYIQDILHYAA